MNDRSRPGWAVSGRLILLAVCGVGFAMEGRSAAQSNDRPVVARQAAAQALFDDARRLLAEGDLVAACHQFEASQKMDPGAGTELNLADCYERRGMLASAWATFRAAGADSRRNGRPEWAEVADERAGALEPRVPVVVLRVVDEPVKATSRLEVSLDGQSIGAESLGSRIPLDPGAHTVVVSAAGFTSFDQPFTLAAGDKQTIDILLLTRAPEPPPKSMPPPPADAARLRHTRDLEVPLGLGAGGLALIGIGLGTYFGVVSSSRNSDAAKACPNPSQCPSQAGPTLAEEAKTAQTESIVALSTGGAFAVASGVLLGLAATHKARVAVAPVAAVSADGWFVGAAGVF